MALILAVNPGDLYSVALARLARALPDHELIGADSCAIAMTEVDRRTPDLVLLPPLPESDEAKLMARLRTVRGVRTLKLPPPTMDDPRLVAQFAAKVREALGAPPGASLPPGASPRGTERLDHLVVAATALVGWVRARRASWDEAVVPEPARRASEAAREPEAAARETATRGPAQKVVPALRAVEAPTYWAADAEAEEPDESVPEPGDKVEARDSRAWENPGPRWLRRLGALVALAALVAVAFSYWPGLSARFTTGELMLDSGPAGSQVFIDGRLAGTTPISVDLPAGAHSVEFRYGQLTRTADVVVVARSRVVQRMDWIVKPSGRLEVRSNPAGARVLVDGTERGTTPLTLETIEPGTHIVVLESAAGSVQRTVTIAAGEATQVMESISPGWLAVIAPFDIEIAEGTALIRPDDRGRVILPAGSHTLHFKNGDLGYDEIRTLEIKSGETATLNLAPQTTIGITATEPADVSIDGVSIGQTPIAKRRIPLGSHVVVLRTATGAEQQFPVTATAKPVQIDADFSTPSPP